MGLVCKTQVRRHLVPKKGAIVEHMVGLRFQKVTDWAAAANAAFQAYYFAFRLLLSAPPDPDQRR